MGRFAHIDFEDRPRAASPEPEEDRWPNMSEEGCEKAADEQFRSGLYEAALVFYSRVLRFNKGREEAWVGQVRCLTCLGEYREAVLWSDRGLERFGESPELLACKGLALVLSGSTAEGMEYLDGALEKRSPSAWVWLARGEALLASREPEVNARRCFLKAQELASGEWHVELRIGMAYNRNRFWAQALPSLQRAVGAAPENALAQYHLGLAREGLGERESASGSFQRALAIRSDFPEAAIALQRVRRSNPFTKVLGKLTRRG